MALVSRGTIETLLDLVPLVRRSAGFADVVSALKGSTLGGSNSAAIDGAWGSSCALCAAALASENSGPLLVVLPRIADVDDFAVDLAGFLDQTPQIFSAWESLPQEHDVADAIFGGRLRVLGALSSEQPPKIIVTSLPALLQPVPSREERERSTRVLRVGEEIEPDALLGWLVDRGFSRVAAIEVPGEFSMHGGIVDLFPPDAVHPLRIEFFGDEIESIRRFEVETQRRLEELSEISLTLVVPTHSPEADAQEGGDRQRPPDMGGESLLDSLPAGSWVVLAELQDLVDEGKHYLGRLDDVRGLFSIDSVLARCAKFPTATIAAIGAGTEATNFRIQTESIERFAGPKNQVIDELASLIAKDEQLLIACHNEGERQRLAELFGEANLPIGRGVELCLGHMTRGFRLMTEGLVVLSDHELFGRVDQHRPPERKGRIETRAIDSFLELREGELVVHLINGIARYRGMELLENEDRVEEHLALEFRDGVRVYVPVSLIDLVQKYVGAAKGSPKLSKLGSAAWAKKKARVARAVTDLASDMIRLQAAREAKPGIAFPRDSHWQREFDASFPFTETPDQMQSIVDVKDDMQKPRPMDRLICGDVGYGKTEVSMRAAFKAIDAGKQVAILVPTTVLAEQHYRTFRERMAEYPIVVEVLSRFKTKSVQRKIIERLESGGVDLVIGTHRLVQKDVRFKDLGLLVIDEEQRFGVEAKEVLKRMRLEVDVLTMSATPIPRTLHMSLLGIRDISNLITPPHGRKPIETRICRFDNELIRSAIVRELNRNGQIFFVHNRVYNIKSIADMVSSTVPEARIGIGHGQMREGELEAAMFDFVSGRTDVFVCTTIIESGLDIPNANTIFIHQADRFGLADLHQLRGRVGRYKQRAYCYLMLEEGRSLSATGAKRLKAIEEFSELGAGFKIAMRDLEIRGAGNILGTQQSGHIASVGYELYCRLLENSVHRLKNEPICEQDHVALHLPVKAFLPDSYVPTSKQKVGMYRKLSNIRDADELDDLQDELRDRFGPLPIEAARLIELTRLRLAALFWQIDDIHLEDQFAVLCFRDRVRLESLGVLRKDDLRVVDKRTAYLPLPELDIKDDALLLLLRSMLQPE